MRLVLSVPDDFDFRNAVCSHGFFVLAPNRWDPARLTLQTAITLDDSTAVFANVREMADRRLAINAPAGITAAHRTALRPAVARMLRIDEDLTDFHTRCRKSTSHASAAGLRFGRLLRSATLFEDIVKVICTCNVTWRQTVAMVDNIVAHWGVPTADGVHRGFPTPALLARASVDDLRTRGRLGYRAAFVHRLAIDVADGRLDLASIESSTDSTADLYRRLKQITGVGNYAAGHLCMLLGRYDRLAIDTEMMRHLKSRHPRRRWTPASIERYYRPWHPYQFLAYWFELWQDYQHHHGQAEQWNPSTPITQLR